MHFSLASATLFLAALASARTFSIDVTTEDQVKLQGNPSIEQNCYWSGTSPFCAGGCDAGYSDCRTSGCGDGACCVTGYKKYCCRGGCASGAQGRLGKLADDDNDDYCPDGQIILCPPTAEKNEDCTCVDNPDLASHKKGL